VEQLWQQIKQRFLSNTTFQNYDDVIERSCQAWNEILSENGFIKNKNLKIEIKVKNYELCKSLRYLFKFFYYKNSKNN
jgi:hypothetical protein